ncbi:DNA alkylation repair protein [Dethiobacter alkaliphilus]|uniref:DNA alkylation repair enzyme n=1 Tax=Dethiobacter alkaliphilus AHT 1 TaxID=555088 RepID=C0GIG7_DETAL|nr:DNA alkylation repair protein [Dethiobacter alkaliphilus]EEG76828.1 conserved hypothetical protein [Dethiobacter alkaliphilus AHT 1]
MDYQEVVERLTAMSRPEAVEGMARFGITPQKVYGVSIPDLRRMAKEIGTDRELAARLWQDETRETRILASMVDDPRQVTEEQMDAWALEFDYWEICDQVCSNLFGRTELAYKKCFDWSKAKEEFVKRAGFVLMARLAVTEKEAPDAKFALFMSLIKDGADDERNYVKKAVNWALRQIGKRNYSLNKLALETAQEIGEMPQTSARWIARDAIRELESERVQEKVQPASFRVILSPNGEVQDIKPYK